MRNGHSRQIFDSELVLLRNAGFCSVRLLRRGEHHKGERLIHGGCQPGIRPELRAFDSFLCSGTGTSLGRGSKRLSGEAACALKYGGLPGVVTNHRLAGDRVGQVTIAFDERFHNVNCTSIRSGTQGIDGTLLIDKDILYRGQNGHSQQIFDCELVLLRDAGVYIAGLLRRGKRPRGGP